MFKEELIIHLIQSGALQTREIIEAFKGVDRADFVAPGMQSLAYEDYALPIGFGQSISQPFTVAFMMELLHPQKGDVVLDLGTGAGWTAALLSNIVENKGKVYSVEIIPELLEEAKKNLDKYDIKNVLAKQAQDRLGLPEFSPFQKILVSAEADHLPDTLISQLATGGTLVMPVAGTIVQVEKISESLLETNAFPGFAFVPLRY
jgi:protein-L-isoaspartate(D-aspartate) O-methyltransferase